MIIILGKIMAIISLSLMIINADACEKTEKVETPAIDAKDFSTCSSNEECTAIKADCCGCNQGGKQEAVNISSAKAMLGSIEQACGDTMCIQMISTDASCSRQAACIDGECRLQ